MNKLAGFLGVLAMVAVAPLAQADLQILVNVNGTPAVCTPTVGTNPQPSATANGTLTCSPISVAGVTITDLAVTGLQAGVVAQELGTTLLITNTSASAATITIDIGVSNYTSLNPPITDSSGSTINGTTGTNSVTLTSCVDQSNALSGCATPPAGMAPPNGTLTVTGASTANNESTGSITSLTAPFSLTQHIVLSAGAGADFNITTSQVLTGTVVTVTVCPMSPGFWKHHPFPAALTFPVSIGGISYSAADFLAILNNPGGGNAVQILGFQLVAALLNAAAGATVPANVAKTIADAENLLTGINMLTDFVAPSSTLGGQMTADAAVLDTFNNTENCTL